TWLTYDVVEFTANIGMFVPLGILIALTAGSRHWWIGFAVGLGYSVVIETLQATILSTTRFATINDVIANGLGALIGALLVRVTAGILRSRRHNRAAEAVQ